MNKLNAARILMVISILLIITFQAYWVRKVFNEEKAAFEKTADLVFRESIYRLQAARFTSDTMVFKGMPDDNLFMGDVVEAVKGVRRTRRDSADKFMISIDAETDNYIHPKRDTVVYVDTKTDHGLPPPH